MPDQLGGTSVSITNDETAARIGTPQCPSGAINDKQKGINKYAPKKAGNAK